MKIIITLIILAIIGIVTVGILDLRNGSFNIIPGFSTNKYESFLSQINAKDLPFLVLSPSYIPPGFKFLKEDSVQIIKGNIGIPQVNYLFETADGKNGLALRQMDKKSYPKTEFSGKVIERDGKTIYIKIPAEKVRSILGDAQYIASAHMINDDSIIELNYSGTVPFSEEELIKIILSL